MHELEKQLRCEYFMMIGFDVIARRVSLHVHTTRVFIFAQTVVWCQDFI